MTPLMTSTANPAASANLQPSISSSWDAIPAELLASVLATDESTDLAVLRLVCKHWMHVIEVTTIALNLKAFPSAKFLEKFPLLNSVSCLQACIETPPADLNNCLSVLQPCNKDQFIAAATLSSGSQLLSNNNSSVRSSRTRGVDDIGTSGNTLPRFLRQLGTTQPNIQCLEFGVHTAEDAVAASCAVAQLTRLSQLTVAAIPIGSRPPQPISTSPHAMTYGTSNAACSNMQQLAHDVTNLVSNVRTSFATALAGNEHSNAVIPMETSFDGLPSPSTEFPSVESSYSATTLSLATSSTDVSASSSPISQSPRTPRHTAIQKLSLTVLESLPNLEVLEVINTSPDYESLRGCQTLRSLRVARECLPLPASMQCNSKSAPGSEHHQLSPQPSPRNSPGKSQGSPRDDPRKLQRSPRMVEYSSRMKQGTYQCSRGCSTKSTSQMPLGPLPTQGLSLKGVGELLQLQHLDMQRAQHAWHLPQDIIQLTNLKSLNVSRNVLAALPADLGLLSQLTRLDITSCCLQALPESFSCLKSLKHLSAGGNPGLCFELSCTAITSLTYLDLSWSPGNNLGQLLVACPDSFQVLEYLNLRGTKVTQLPPSFSLLLGLKHLILSANPITEFPVPLLHLTGLTQLDLSMCQLTELPGGLSTAPVAAALTSLDLHANMLVKLPTDIGLLSRLASLDVSANMLVDLPESLTRSFSLKHLKTGLNPLSLGV